jgi:carbon storage regulator CsrA
MLVLSRRESDKILFPSLGISVEVLRIQGNKARLGISAPSDVPILRHEIADLKDVHFAPGKKRNDDRLRNLVFAIRNRLDVATSGLNQLHTSLDEGPGTGQSEQALIEELYSELRSLEREANQILEDSGMPVNQTPQALLVEDSATERQLLEAYLDLCGFAVTTAEDGQDALDYLSLHARPDVVLLDMMMPRIDGPAFVRAVRSDPKLRGLSIFALTGMEREDVDIPTGFQGVNRWYVKPVNPRTLVHDVAMYLTEAPTMVA